MTQEEAKEYVLTHLPCTMLGVVALFDTYFHGSVKLEKLVGLSAGVLGYRRVVFTLRFDFKVMAEIHPMPSLKHLMACFRAWAAFQGFKIEREGFDMEDKECMVVWAKAPVEIKRIGALDTEYFKDEALRMLYEPMEEIAHIFQAAFIKSDHESDLISCDWKEGTIIVEFTRRQPSSDTLRHTIFTIYQKEWGGKPLGLDVIYKALPDSLGLFRDSSRVRLYITSNPVFISMKLRQGNAVVIDSKEFDDWKASQVHNVLKRAQKPKTFDPGAPVPVVRMGLFKV